MKISFDRLIYGEAGMQQQGMYERFLDGILKR